MASEVQFKQGDRTLTTGGSYYWHTPQAKAHHVGPAEKVGTSIETAMR